MIKTYEYCVVGCAFDIAPILAHVALVSCTETDVLPIPECIPYQGEWGKNETAFLLEESYHMLPKGIHIIYLSLVEHKFYIINEALPIEKIKEMWVNSRFNKIIVGMAPYGNVAVWLSSPQKSLLVSWLYGREISIDMKSFLPNNPNVRLEHLCQQFINDNSIAKAYHERYGIPSHKLFEGYMKQFSYKYLLLFEYWNKDKNIWMKYNQEEESVYAFKYMEDSCYDGTHDKLHDGGLLKYHQAGKPKKLAIKWHIGKSEYSAYFWFEEEPIREVFDKFYGAHPDTKTDFIIRIDAENRKYELALYRYGLKEPQIIPENVYQLLVFKNKFEDYRSDNYNQERGAWIW